MAHRRIRVQLALHFVFLRVRERRARREQLADLLAQSSHPEAALAEYEKALQNAPGRRGALRGALESARSAGAKSKSSYYEAELKNLN